MKGFYESYQVDEKLAPLVRKIGWSHNLVILERCKESQQREFYIRMTKKFGWSKNVLVHQIDNKSFEKTLLNRRAENTSFSTTNRQIYRQLIDKTI
jgi:predicted nuclease of restriction endonuclease-like (RecB) superfamily